jgi:hypothetical protein
MVVHDDAASVHPVAASASAITAAGSTPVERAAATSVGWDPPPPTPFAGPIEDHLPDDDV